jgi:hypothetical protein
MAPVQIQLALAATLLVAAALTACGGGGKTPTTTPRATNPAHRQFAPPISNAEVLRRLPASCRSQLIDPRVPASIRDRNWRHYRRELTLHPDAGRNLMCGSISGN